LLDPRTLLEPCANYARVERIQKDEPAGVTGYQIDDG
jgi:hypothetical protein